MYNVSTRFFVMNLYLYIGFSLNEINNFNFFSLSDAPQLNLKLGSATLSLQSIQEGNDIYFGKFKNYII